MPGSDAELRNLLHELRDSFQGKEQVNGYTYKRLTGLTSHTDEKGLVTLYDYDPYGRLTTVKDHNGNFIEKYTYRMVNTSNESITSFSVNTPIMTTFNQVSSGGGQRSYNAILPGGEVTGSNTEWCNMVAENYLLDGDGIHLYPDTDGTIPIASVEIFASCHFLNLYSFPSRIDVDLIKDGNVVYTSTVPINNLSNPAPRKSKILYIPAGEYQVSIKPDKQTQYHLEGIPVQLFRELGPSYYPEPIRNFSTVTLETGKMYELMITGPV